MTAFTSDIVVIGGGVIGLSIACELGRRGASVLVLGQRQKGQASSVAAGMLAPLAEASEPGPFLNLALDSLHRYPDFLATLREESGTDIAACGPGMLRVARTEEEESALCRALSWQPALGLPLHRLTGEEARGLEPALSPSVRAAVLSPAETHLPPHQLLAAFIQVCYRYKVSTQPWTAATGLEFSGGRISAVHTAEGRRPCRAVVLAGGAWNPFLLDWLHFSVPIFPLRGQIMTKQSLREPPLQVPFRHTIYTHGAYLVPRPNGEVIAGATEEKAGYDADTTTEGHQSLHRSALALVPALASLGAGKTRVGLRPMSADGLPLLGRVPGFENAHLAGGHGRNGILLTPITAALMADAILNNAPIPTAFDPARFGDTA